MLFITHKHTVHFFKITFLILGFNLFTLQGQNPNDITFEDASMKIGFKQTTNGSGIFYRNARPLRDNWSKAFDIDLSSIRHPKEKDIINTRMGNTRPYIFNKINRVYNLRLLGGLQYKFADRNTKNSVGIAAFAGVGPAITFIKPVFLDIQIIDPNAPNTLINVSRRYEPEKFQHSQIVGNSSYLTGINETKLGVGLSFKCGVEFNWGSFSSEYKSLELGIVVDCLTARPEIIYKEKNKMFYSGFYLSFAFGKNR